MRRAFQCNNCGYIFDEGDAVDREVCSCHINPPCTFCVDGDTCPECDHNDVEELKENYDKDNDIRRTC